MNRDAGCPASNPFPDSFGKRAKEIQERFRQIAEPFEGHRRIVPITLLNRELRSLVRFGSRESYQIQMSFFSRRDLLWIGAPIKHKLNVCAFEQTLALAASSVSRFRDRLSESIQQFGARKFRGIRCLLGINI